MPHEPSDMNRRDDLEPAWPRAEAPMEPAAAPERRGGPRGFTALAWVLIILMVALRLVLLAMVEQDTVGPDLVGRTLMRIQGRYLVGAAQVAGEGPALYSQSTALNAGTVDQRLRFAVLAGELAGPGEARKILDGLAGLIHEEEQQTAYGENPFRPRAENREAMALLRKLYAPGGEGIGNGPAGGDTRAGAAEPAELINIDALTADERDALVETLGWFGELALAPPGTENTAAREAVLAPALRTFVAVIVAFVAACIVGFGGFIGLVVMIVFLAMRLLRSGIEPGAAHHGLYAETFALWLLAFLVLQLGAEAVSLVAGGSPVLVMFAVLFAFFLSLVVLGWPVLRGVPWSQVRADIGWTVGRTRSAGAWPIEVVIGLAGYAMTLPILAVGVALTFVLIVVDQALAGAQPTFAPAGGPAHPIIAELAEGNVLLIVLVLALGSIAAPIVEETMFRGVLYRHLRDVSATLGLLVSIVFSTALTGFIFAVIHPQGWVAIPALMALATGFTLAREWRGTLIPAVVMHAVSNGIVLGMVVFLAGR
ncbi:MAG: type II CAAX endopeptidase family protein [Planctomycetota bacterium]|nr:type II CAAX endopeptidase family protein [Planctomycetota bacterium]